MGTKRCFEGAGDLADGAETDGAAQVVVPGGRRRIEFLRDESPLPADEVEELRLIVRLQRGLVRCQVGGDAGSVGGNLGGQRLFVPGGVEEPAELASVAGLCLGVEVEAAGDDPGGEDGAGCQRIFEEQVGAAEGTVGSPSGA